MSGIGFAAFERRLAEEPAPSPARTGTATADDGVDLSYALHEPTGACEDLLVFYHGGGVNRRAGYDRLAAALAARLPLAVCLPDIRGHGNSGGPRGHARRRDAPLRDVESLTRHLLRERPAARLWLGAHSSGAGLLLNALSGGWPRAPVAGVLLLAPNFGYHAALEREGAGFSGAGFWPFVVNWFTGGRLAGGVAAVQLDFSGAPGARAIGAVSRYTVNMALAVTPDDPGGQLARIAPPIWVGLAGADEILDAERTAAFLARHAPGATVAQLETSTHLGVILDGAPAMAAALLRLGLPRGAGGAGRADGRAGMSASEFF